MKDRLDWESDGLKWPYRAESSFVHAGGIQWRVQWTGSGPLILLIHGTGASTHSWAPLIPYLKDRFTLLAVDLPGHAFTGNPGRDRLTLPGMAGLVHELLLTLKVQPAVVAGHSAGAAILMRMCLDGHLAPKMLISLNGAILPLGGFAGSLFSPLARLLVLNPLVPRFFAWRATSKDAVKRLLEGTGSSVDPALLEIYWMLFQTRAHVEGTLEMMAGWDLHALEEDLPRLTAPVRLIAATNDKAIPFADAARVQKIIPHAEIVPLKGLGHLAHEEQPARVAAALAI